MTNEEHIENLKAIASDMPSDKCADWIESLMAGVKALEQEPCADMVSRDAMWEVLQRLYGTEGELVEELMSLPPVLPMPKMGKWLIKRVVNYDHAICSVCGDDSFLSPEWDALELYKYCPNCGCKIQGVEE